MVIQKNWCGYWLYLCCALSVCVACLHLNCLFFLSGLFYYLHVSIYSLRFFLFFFSTSSTTCFVIILSVVLCWPHTGNIFVSFYSPVCFVVRHFLIPLLTIQHHSLYIFVLIIIFLFIRTAIHCITSHPWIYFSK